MSSGSAHRPVLLREAVEALRVRPDGVYVDGTFGRGGHSRAILDCLGERGRLIAFDRDPAAVAAGAAINDGRFRLVYGPFSGLSRTLEEMGLEKVDGVLLDLGVSSPQLDEAERGFSFRFEGPLDMRMDTGTGETAAEWLARVSQEQLEEVIRVYGEERFAKQVAKAIVEARSREPIVTTRQLAAVVAKAVKKREPNQDPATRTFQAIRIYLNGELEELSLVLPQAAAALAEGGRLAVISFHSLEDRIVKRFIREAGQSDKLPSKLPVRHADLPQPKLRAVGKAVRAGEAEVKANPRARSAVLRVAERTAAPWQS